LRDRGSGASGLRGRRDGDAARGGAHPRDALGGDRGRYTRANSAKADALSAVDASALAALNAPNRGQARKDAIRIIEQSVHQARGSVEALKPKVDWIDSSTVEV
jgi:hypothetical protein